MSLGWGMLLTVCLPAHARGQAGGAPDPPSPPPLEAEAAGDPAAAVPEAAVAPDPAAATVTLGEAVALALQHNFDLLQSADGVASARHSHAARLAQFFPKLTPRYQRSADASSFGLDAAQKLPWTGGSVTATAGFLTAPDAPVPSSRTSTLNLTLTQPLLRGFGPNASLFDLRNSRRDRQARERGHELSRQRVAVDVTRAFYQVLEQRTLLAVARQSLQRTEALVRASEARLQVGLVSKLDLFRAQLQGSQARESMLRAETALQDALERFRVLLGREPAEALEPAAVTLPSDLPQEDWPELAVLVQQALAARLDLQEARDEVDDARRSASLARQNLLPQLDLNLGLSHTGLGPSLGQAWSAADKRVTFSFAASYPIERSVDLANKALSEIALEGSRRLLRQRQLETETQVRAALRELEQIRKSAALQQQGVDVAGQQLRLATLRYQRGLASNFDVVDAESALVVARSALASLLARYQVARVELLRVTGQLEVEREFQR